VLFTQVAMFTYVTFHLGAPPHNLTTAALGWLFIVYLIGAAVTPIAGRWIDMNGHRRASGWEWGLAPSARSSPLSPRCRPLSRAGSRSDRVFISQATASSYIGAVTAQDEDSPWVVRVLLLRRRKSWRGAPGLFWQSGGGLRVSRWWSSSRS